MQWPEILWTQHSSSDPTQSSDPKISSDTTQSSKANQFFDANQFSDAKSSATISPELSSLSSIPSTNEQKYHTSSFDHNMNVVDDYLNINSGSKRNETAESYYDIDDNNDKRSDDAKYDNLSDLLIEAAL